MCASPSDGFSPDAALLRELEQRALALRGQSFDPARDTAILREVLAQPREAMTPSLIVGVWRQLLSAGVEVAVWGGRDPASAMELSRQHFGHAAFLRQAAKPEDAIAAARRAGGVGVGALDPDNAWWGRLLAEPRVRVFAALPGLAAWGPLSALALADVAIEPTGDDNTFWVTDAPGSGLAIEEALGHDGAAATQIAEAGGLKLFLLAGFYQANDPRLARAPGRLSGVIGAAPAPLDV
jgi:hypothetical protein